MSTPLRIAVCIKQIPAFADMELGADGLLQREGVPLELNPYCRRAVALGATLAHTTGGSVTVITMGPPSAQDAVREALAWCDQHDATATGVLISDPALRGSDTLATAQALHATLDALGPFDLVLMGRNSVDADTGQVGPEVAELLGWPFLTAVKHFEIDGATINARCEHDDGAVQIRTTTPAVVSCAERLCDPAKVDPQGRAAVDDTRITTMGTAQLGPGPWGAAASPTWVGPTRTIATSRRRVLEPGTDLDTQIARALETLDQLGALDPSGDHARDLGRVPVETNGPATTIAVIAEPGRAHLTREMLGAAATLATAIDARVVAFVAEGSQAHEHGAWGADHVIALTGSHVEEDLAHAIGDWCARETPWAALAPSTAWGREIASRIAARLSAGLTGDAVELDVTDGRLVAWKPAFGGQLLAAITATSPVQMTTVRAGMLGRLEPRVMTATIETIAVAHTSRIEVLARTRDDNLDTLAEAPVVIGVGRGVAPDQYAALQPLLDVLDGELAATRKVTDQGWLPRARQLGITGRSISPRLYVAIGIGGKFNHTVGVRSARCVLAINSDPNAPVFDTCDAGIVGDWVDVVPKLTAALSLRFSRRS
jgi:electron transfer flavoprotein alpha subunit